MSTRKEIANRAGVRAQKTAAKTRDAQDGWAAYHAAAAATEAKSARLKALRLEREAANEQPAAKPPLRGKR